MDAYRNKGIKDIIDEFPKVGEILSEYGIECVSCTVGICALKDILDIKQMLIALDTIDTDSLRENLTAYAALLREHINKEDEILFPWLDRSLSSEQIAELAGKFAGADRNLAVDTEKYLAFVEGLEARLQN